MIHRTSQNPRNILVRSPNWIGDQILSYPFFYFLRRAFPTARIRVACVPWVSSIQFLDLVNEVSILDMPKAGSFRQKLEALEAAALDLKRAGPWDLGISLPNSISAAWLLFRAGCRSRRGYAGDGRTLLLSERVRRRAESVHRANAYLDLLPDGVRPKLDATVFWGIPPENDLDPGVPGVTTFDPVKSWSEANVLTPPEGDYWVLAPGSVAISRRWPIESFSELAERIIRERNWPVVVVGGAAEAGAAEAIARNISRPELVMDLVGKGAGVSAYSRLFGRARFTVSNDSGLAHVASICGSPVHVVWGAGNPNHTAPIGPGKSKLTLNAVECWPCERNTCSREEGALECLRPIQPERVWEEMKIGLRI